MSDRNRANRVDTVVRRYEPPTRRDEQRYGVFADPVDVRRRFSGVDLAMVLALASRVGFLTARIAVKANLGQVVTYDRLERKALRWALERLGLTLRPNPAVPALAAHDGPPDRVQHELSNERRDDPPDGVPCAEVSR